MSKDKVKKPIYKKWWFWLIVVFIVIGVAGGEEDTASNNTTNTNNNKPKQEQAKQSKNEKQEEVKGSSKEEPKTPIDKIKVAAKEAGMTDVEVEDKGNGNYIIKTQAPMNFANSQYSGSVPTKIADVLKDTKDVDFKALYFDFWQDMVDDKGKSFTNPALLVLFTKNTVNTINLDNWPAKPTMVYTACTAYAFDSYPWTKELKEDTKKEIGTVVRGVSNLPDDEFKTFAELQSMKYK